MNPLVHEPPRRPASLTPVPQKRALARQVDFDRLPAHIAVIMDGNGRWAAQRHLPRVEGHRAGIESVRETVESSARLGIKVLTLYAFSVENWKRPATEVSTLMLLLKRYLRSELNTLLRNNIRFKVDRPARGSVARYPARAARRGGEDRDERRHAVQHRAELRRPRRDRRGGAAHAGGRPRAGRRSTRRASSSYLYTAGQPDPDLLIRTSGEMRVSNFLLWQIAYAEIWVTDTLWPDFRQRHLLEAILDYQKRDRRYGGINQPAVAGR